MGLDPAAPVVLKGTLGMVAANISPHSLSLLFPELFAKPQLDSSALHLDQGEILSLWCSIPGAPAANFSIQKGDVVLSQTQNFTIVASEWDSGTYSCIAGIGKVFKKSNLVNITVCGESVMLLQRGTLHLL